MPVGRVKVETGVVSCDEGLDLQGQGGRKSLCSEVCPYLGTLGMEQVGQRQGYIHFLQRNMCS